MLPGIQAVQAMPGASQPSGDGGEREAGPGGYPGSGDGQCERKMRAQRDQLGHRVGFGGGPRGADAASHELPGVRFGEDTEHERAGALRGDQPGELAAARHQHHARRAAG